MVYVPGAFTISVGACHSHSLIIVVWGLESHVKVSCEDDWFWLWDLVKVGFKNIPKWSTNVLQI